MANDTDVGLIWRLRAEGTQQVQAALRSVADAEVRSATVVGGYRQRAVSSISDLAARTRNYGRELPRVTSAVRSTDVASPVLVRRASPPSQGLPGRRAASGPP